MTSLVEVSGLSKRYRLSGGFLRKRVEVRAVDRVSFSIEAGETLALVGETGSGKSTIGRLLLRLVEPSDGRVSFDGRDIGRFASGELKVFRRQAQMLFQDPSSSLNPRKSVRQILLAPLEVHGWGSRSDREARVRETLDLVGLEATHLQRYPHQLSGGQRQRVGIARGLILEPRFLVADEPVSALDVSTRAQILNLLADLRERLQLTYLFISHDLAVVESIADRVVVLYLGRIAEIGPAESLFARPIHPYSQALIRSHPVADPRQRRPRQPLTGELPSPVDPPSGCSFHPRCPLASAICREAEPPILTIGDRTVACHHWEHSEELWAAHTSSTSIAEPSPGSRLATTDSR